MIQQRVKHDGMEHGYQITRQLGPFLQGAKGWVRHSITHRMRLIITHFGLSLILVCYESRRDLRDAGGMVL